MAVLFVPLFHHFRLGAILAYLFAGILIGPDVFGFIKDPDVILQFSELGVVFLLFIIGLELAPEKLWQMRKAIFGLGFLQVLLSAMLFTAIGSLLGLSFTISVVAGCGLALSSTAFSIQLLNENHQLNTTHGQGSFSILMFQDLAVIPILASLELLGAHQTSGPSFLGLIKVLGIVVVLVFVGRFLIRHILRWIAESRVQEVFTATALFIVMGTAYLMESVGLSMGMGAFFAGVLLANSEYRHELEINLLPFKGLLLGLFFIAVGMALDLNVIADKPHVVILLTLGFMLLKGLIIYGLGILFRYPKQSARNMAFTLPQGGEFAFVLFGTALGLQLISSEFSSLLSAAVTLSMALTPLVFKLNQKYFRTYSEISEKPFDKIEGEEPEVIIAGFGRFGQIVARFLRSESVKYTILEHSAAQVESARKFGNKIYYGDASRSDILRAAGAETAKIFVLAIDDTVKSIEVAKLVQKEFPNIEIIARVRNRQHAIDLFRLGIKTVHRETYLTSLEVAKEVLLFKGVKREYINKRLAKFRRHDEDILKKQHEFKGDEEQFISFTNAANQQLESILGADRDNDLAEHHPEVKK